MKFTTSSILLALAATVLAQDAGVSSIVSEVDSIKSQLYGLSTLTDLAAASSLGAELGSFIASVTTNSDWPSASSILASQAATDSAALSSAIAGESSALNSASAAASSAVASAHSTSSSGSSSGPRAVFVSGSGLIGAAAAAMGVLGAAVML